VISYGCCAYTSQEEEAAPERVKSDPNGRDRSGIGNVNLVEREKLPFAG
jgi:hypothetical protein